MKLKQLNLVRTYFYFRKLLYIQTWKFYRLWIYYFGCKFEVCNVYSWSKIFSGGFQTNSNAQHQSSNWKWFFLFKTLPISHKTHKEELESKLLQWGSWIWFPAMCAGQPCKRGSWCWDIWQIRHLHKETFVQANNFPVMIFLIDIEDYSIMYWDCLFIENSMKFNNKFNNV